MGSTAVTNERGSYVEGLRTLKIWKMKLTPEGKQGIALCVPRSFQPPPPVLCRIVGIYAKRYLLGGNTELWRFL